MTSDGVSRPLSVAIEEIRASIATVIVGQQSMVDLLLAAILSDGHVLLEGVPGVAKTLSARLIAKMLECNFSRIQLTPDLMPADIVGTSIFDPKQLDFVFRKGPVFSNIVLVDEINRAPAKTQSALFEVMEERQITVDGTTYPLESPFIVLATQNPIEQEGTYRLPEAQLDRFLFKITVGYPSLEEETTILSRHHQLLGKSAIENIKPVLSAADVARYRQEVKGASVEEHLLKYIAQIVHNTRLNQAIYLGASPRASLGILNAAKAVAVIQGRDFVIPDDIQYVTPPVLRHRIQLTPEREMEGVSTDQVIQDILRGIEIPR